MDHAFRVHSLDSIGKLLDCPPGEFHGATIAKSLLQGCSKRLLTRWLDEHISNRPVFDQVLQLCHSFDQVQLLKSVHLLLEDMKVRFVTHVEPLQLVTFSC